MKEKIQMIKKGLKLKIFLKFYEKNYHLRNTDTFFNIPPSILARWIKKKMNIYQQTINLLIIN